MSEINVEKGHILVFRIFTIGHELDLIQGSQILKDSRFQLNSPTEGAKKSILINEHPLILDLDPWNENILGKDYNILVTAKLWSFGCLSLQLKLSIDNEIPFQELCNLSYFFENDESFHQKTIVVAKDVLKALSPAIQEPNFYKQCEDYLILNITKLSKEPEDLRKFFVTKEVCSFILGEKLLNLSPQVVNSLASGIYQYTKDDLIILHWNGSVIYDKEDYHHIAFAIEFALCQLLELRYYDDLLDKQLNVLYQKIEHTRATIFHNPYKELSKKAALEYIDISEVVDKVSNAFKVIGDFYYATIYRGATDLFHIATWKSSVDQKLGNLAEVSKLFQGEIDERRNQLMELVIIVLIGIEVFPYIYKLF